jgi:hypothetical protein
MLKRAFWILRIWFLKCAKVQSLNGRKLKKQKTKNRLFLKEKQVRASHEVILASETIKLKRSARLD